jgi:hypothetical protein
MQRTKANPYTHKARHCCEHERDLVNPDDRMHALTHLNSNRGRHAISNKDTSKLKQRHNIQASMKTHPNTPTKNRIRRVTLALDQWSKTPTLTRACRTCTYMHYSTSKHTYTHKRCTCDNTHIECPCIHAQSVLVITHRTCLHLRAKCTHDNTHT